jgi:cytochrome c-type biogenesis protein CcmH
VTAAALVLAIALGLTPVATAAMAPIKPIKPPPQRASLTDIESNVMCVVCKTPLAVSQSPEADRERALINGLIAKGDTKSQILNAMVVQYGPAVLALPPAHGFNLTVYILPPAILILGAAGLAFTLPRWRRRTRTATTDTDRAGPALDPSESRRLEDELAQYGR